jgi:hypothetical protein
MQTPIEHVSFIHGTDLNLDSSRHTGSKGSRGIVLLIALCILESTRHTISVVLALRASRVTGHAEPLKQPRIHQNKSEKGNTHQNIDKAHVLHFLYTEINGCVG